MILIASEGQDVHARRVTSLLRDQGHAVSFVHASEFDEERTLSLDPTTGEGVLKKRGGPPIYARDVSAVWYRRPGLARADSRISNTFDRAFAQTEWQHALDGFFSMLGNRVVSPPFQQRAAIKPRQLAAARLAGLRVPETLISNDVDEVTTFVKKHRHVIHKASSSPPHRFIDTRRWGSVEEGHFNDISLCPIILQEEIEGPSDVRATIVGQRVFAARIDKGTRYSGPDSRLDLDAPCVPHSLPDEIADALLNIMNILGLLFATIDLKLTTSNEYVFFEANPQGQFLYIEILTEQPISAAVAKLLSP